MPDEIDEAMNEVKEKLGPKQETIVNVDKDLDDLVADMPQVVPDAVEAGLAKEAQETEEKLFADKKGRTFDPNVHASGPDGKPVYTPTGRFKMKLRLPQSGKVNLPDEKTNSVPGEYRLVAQTIVSSFIQVGYAFVGDEWLPEKSKEIDEEANLVSATETYCASTGFRDLPPGLVVAVAFIGYGIKRFGKPKTKSLVDKATSWVKTKATNFWLWITGQKIKIVPTGDK